MMNKIFSIIKSSNYIFYKKPTEKLTTLFKQTHLKNEPFTHKAFSTKQKFDFIDQFSYLSDQQTLSYQIGKKVCKNINLHHYSEQKFIDLFQDPLIHNDLAKYLVMIPEFKAAKLINMIVAHPHIDKHYKNSFIEAALTELFKDHFIEQKNVKLTHWLELIKKFFSQEQMSAYFSMPLTQSLVLAYFKDQEMDDHTAKNQNIILNLLLDVNKLSFINQIIHESMNNATTLNAYFFEIIFFKSQFDILETKDLDLIFYEFIKSKKFKSFVQKFYKINHFKNEYCCDSLIQVLIKTSYSPSNIDKKWHSDFLGFFENLNQQSKLEIKWLLYFELPIKSCSQYFQSIPFQQMIKFFNTYKCEENKLILFEQFLPVWWKNYPHPVVLIFVKKILGTFKEINKAEAILEKFNVSMQYF